MTKNFLLSLLMILCVACGKSGGDQLQPASVADDEIISLDEISTEAPLPSAALNFDVQLKLLNFNSAQEDKVLEAAELIKKVVASDEFKKAVLNHKYKGKKTFVDNKGLSNAKIYKKILEGSEVLKPGKDNTMDLTLKVYKASNNTVGYTYPSELKVWMNAKYLNANSPSKVTTNMMHEWLHKLGFGHDKEATPSRKYSVPYAIGYLVARLAKNY